MSDSLDDTEKVRSFLDALQTSSLMLRFLENRNRRAVVRPSNAIAHSTLKTILSYLINMPEDMRSVEF